MNHKVNDTVILNNERMVRIICVDAKSKKYKGRDEETGEEVTFPESQILVSY